MLTARSDRFARAELLDTDRTFDRDERIALRDKDAGFLAQEATADTPAAIAAKAGTVGTLSGGLGPISFSGTATNLDLRANVVDGVSRMILPGANQR